MKNRILLLLISVLLIFSCNEKNMTPREAMRIVGEWTGKTVKFPNLKYFCLNKDSVPETYKTTKKYKILLYIDSTGCTGCRLRLPVWKTFIEELGEQADFLFYFCPKTEKALLSLLKTVQFNYPVYIDIKDKLNKLNGLPTNSKYQCFLLDRDNRVLTIGNPTLNPQVWELYKKIITGKTSDKSPVTTAELERQETELTDLQTGKTSETVFKIKNTGTQPLIIHRIESSCDCTVPEWSRQPVAPDKSTEIKVKITPEKQEYFNKTVTVHCNVETGLIIFKINGTVKN